MKRRRRNDDTKNTEGERVRRALDAFQDVLMAEREGIQEFSRNKSVNAAIKRIKSVKATYKAPPGHTCSRIACNPENENALIARGALSPPSVNPHVYVCRYGAVHACEAGTTCSARTVDDVDVCDVSGRTIGFRHGGIEYGQAFTFVCKRRVRAKNKSDVSIANVVVDLPSTEFAGSTNSVDSVDFNDFKLETRARRARASSGRRRGRRRRKIARTIAWTSANVADARFSKDDELHETSQRRQCVALIDRLFYSSRRVGVHAEHLVRTNARARQALCKYYQTRGNDRGTTIHAAFSTYLEAAAASDRFCAPRQPRNERFVRFFGNVCLVQWRLIRGSPWGRDNGRRFNFEETCLAVLYCMHSGGKILFDRQALPRCEYVTRYAPLSSDLEAYGIPGQRLRNGTKCMRAAYNSINNSCVSSQVAFEKLQRDRWAPTATKKEKTRPGDAKLCETSSSPIDEGSAKAPSSDSLSLVGERSAEGSTPMTRAVRLVDEKEGAEIAVSRRRPRRKTAASPHLKLMRFGDDCDADFGTRKRTNTRKTPGRYPLHRRTNRRASNDS